MNDLLVNGMLSDNGMTCVLDALVMPRSMAFWMSSLVIWLQIVAEWSLHPGVEPFINGLFDDHDIHWIEGGHDEVRDFSLVAVARYVTV